MPFPAMPRVVCAQTYARALGESNKKRKEQGRPLLGPKDRPDVFQCGGICRGKDRFDVTLTCKLCGTETERPVSKDKANRGARSTGSYAATATA